MDKAYGTDRMYKEFIDACHQRGMAVILDVVYNHATGANPFAKMWWLSLIHILQGIYDHMTYDFIYPDIHNVLRFLDNHDTDRFLNCLLYTSRCV